jgi:hypothetical protein
VFSRGLESGGRYCVGALGRTLTSISVKMFPHLIYSVRKFIKSVLSMNL